MQNHNEYLKQIESYLEDLPVIEKMKILNEINVLISDKEAVDLINPLEMANNKRSEHGFVKYVRERKFSFSRFLLKFIMVTSVFSILGLTFLVWKFTPLLKVDEKNNRVIILGGLIDIDGKAGKVKIIDDYHFSDDSFNNDFKANLELGPEKDEVVIEFSSGNIKVQTSETADVQIDCKLSNQPNSEMIQNQEDLVKISFKKMDGVTCDISIPAEKKATLYGESGNVFINKPEFDIYVELKSGKTSILPEPEIDYKYDLTTSSGYIGAFESSEEENALEITVNVKSGSIISQ